MSLTHQAAELFFKSRVHIGELIEERITTLTGCHGGCDSVVHVFSCGLGVGSTAGWLLSWRTRVLGQESGSELQLLLGLSSTIELFVGRSVADFEWDECVSGVGKSLK